MIINNDITDVTKGVLADSHPRCALKKGDVFSTIAESTWKGCIVKCQGFILISGQMVMVGETIKAFSTDRPNVRRFMYVDLRQRKYISSLTKLDEGVVTVLLNT